MIKWLKAATCALALLVCVALPVEARHHQHHGRHFRNDRRFGLMRHENSANPTPGIPRRVRRGRNLTPGIPRGPIGHRVGAPIIRDDRVRIRDRDADEILRRERNRDRDLDEAIGRGRSVNMGRGSGIGMRHGGGRGHGRRP